MRCLLDKVTARYAVQGLLKLAEGRVLTEQEMFTLDLFAQSQSPGLSLFIAPPSVNVVYRLMNIPRYAGILHYFLERVRIALPSRYFKRWARRLRGYGFTREDAAILALATFCTDETGMAPGMDFVATYDRPMTRHWLGQQRAIRDRLMAMQRDMQPPYCDARLPQVLSPEQITPRVVEGGEW